MKGRHRQLPPHLVSVEPLGTSALMRLHWAHSAYAVVLMYEPEDKTWRSAVVLRDELPELRRQYVDQNRDHAVAHAVREIVREANG